MRPDAGVLGVFADPAAAAKAVTALKGAGYSDVRAAMPAPFPALVAALGRPRSPLGPITAAGALLGAAIGLTLCISMSLSWPLVTGGKPIVSIPPFVVVAFELSVLIGTLVNLSTLAITTKRGMRRRVVPHDLRFSHDRIGIFVAGGDPAPAEAVLHASGAEEVQRVA